MRKEESLLRCAIIGYGYMGEIRRRTIENHPDLELAMICDSDSSKLIGSYSFEVVRNSKDVIDSTVDLVFICTPNNLIPKLTIQCFNKGKHVFCEKPPGRSLKDIIRIREAEKENQGIKLMFGLNHRYHPGIMRAKAIIDSGQLGEIISIRGLYGKSGGKNYPNSWRNNKDLSGGGILIDQGIHMLDLFHYFLGEVASVKAFFSNKYWKFEVEDNAVVILKTASGQLALLHSSSTFWKHKFQVHLILEKGYITVEGLLSESGSYGREIIIIGRQQFEDESEAIGNPSEEIIYFDKDKSWEMEVNKMVDCILNDQPVRENSSQDAYNVMYTLDRAYKESKFYNFNKDRK